MLCFDAFNKSQRNGSDMCVIWSIDALSFRLTARSFLELHESFIFFKKNGKLIDLKGIGNKNSSFRCRTQISEGSEID